MALVQAKCENCGASLEVDNALKAAICPHCGSAYVVQDAINNYNYVTNIDNLHADVVNMVDESSSKARIAAADAYMKVKDYKKAEAEYTKAIEIAPQNYIGWWGYIKAYTQNFTLPLEQKSQFDKLATYYNSVFTFVPNEIRSELYNDWCAYYNVQLENYNKNWYQLGNKIADYQKEVDRLAKEAKTAQENAQSCYDQAMKTAPRTEVGSSFKFIYTKNLCVVTVLFILIMTFGLPAYFLTRDATVKNGCFWIMMVVFLVECLAIGLAIWKHAKFKNLCQQGKEYNEEKDMYIQKLNAKRMEMVQYERALDSMKR